MGKPKVVKQTQNLYKGKAPKGVDKLDTLDDAKFRWRCTSIDLEGEWGFRKVECDVLWRDIMPKLHDFESMTWNEIISARSTSNHTMPIANIEEPAKNRLRQLGFEQLEHLFQLSIAGKPRLWGFKEKSTFNLLWFDPEHTVYIVEKKNT